MKIRIFLSYSQGGGVPPGPLCADLFQNKANIFYDFCYSGFIAQSLLFYLVEPSNLRDTPGCISYCRLGEQRAPALHHIQPRPARALGECRGEEYAG